MAFSFGFSGDDIDVDIEESEVEQPGQGNQTSAPDNASLPELVEAKKHDMGEWIPTLPSQISYNKLQLNASQAGNEKEDGERSITLARREVFDIRAQLMAEDSTEQENNEELISGLEHGDIKPNFYEGGFKTWECALDLAKLVVGEDTAAGAEDGDCHIIELGAGTAIPSLALFAQLLSQPETPTQQKRTRFTFADYNSSVLRLVTLPNLILTWNHLISSRQKPSVSTDVTAPSESEKQTQENEKDEEEEELDITPELLENFQQDLTKRGITVDFISGAWSPAFVDLVFSSSSTGENGRNSRTLVLASETIYSPSSLRAFSETLLALLQRSAATTEESKSRALVAAKKVYFGVGGGVDEFLAVLKEASHGSDVDVNEVDIISGGVGRVILEVAQPESTRT